MKEIDAASFARTESTLLAIFSRSLLRPDMCLARELKDGRYSCLLFSLVDGAPEDMREVLARIESFELSMAAKSTEEIRLVLEVDYNRLFVGPGTLLAPPYESYYDSEPAGCGRGRLRTKAEHRVLATYREHGFTMPEKFVDLPDHAAIELEFLSILSAREAEAWERGDDAKALALQEEATLFLGKHLGSWFGKCAERVAVHASTVFYAAVAVLVGKTISLIHEGS